MDFIYTVKFICIGLLLFTTAKLIADGRFSARAAAFALFTFSVAGYLGCQICHTLQAPRWVSQVIHVGCFMVPWAFYMMNDALFEDRFRFRWMHLWAFLFIEFVNFFLAGYLRIYDIHAHGHQREYDGFLRAIPRIVAMAYIFVALFKTLSKRQKDLVEERRNFRLTFVSINGTYMFAVLVSELALQGQKAPDLIDALHTTGILLTVLYFMNRIFSVGGHILGGFAESTGKEKAGAPVDPELLKKLQDAMAVDRAYTRESLSIRALAEQLGVQEYLLRRLINGGLGYRNFNDYLNELRINEAARILADAGGAATPIIRLAMDLGFGSLAPFNKAFKERKGMTPTEFRKKPERLP